MSSKTFRIGIGIQSAKGVPADPQFWTWARSSDLGPSRETSRLEETNSSRDQSDLYTTRLSLGGGFDTYYRPTIGGLLMYLLLGANATTGAAAPFSHEARPAEDQPFVTVVREWNNELFEQFVDCKVTAGTIGGQAGQPIIMSGITIKGLKFERLTVAKTTGVLDTGQTVRVPGATYTVDGAANSAISEWSLQVTNEQNTAQTNEINDSYIEPGMRTLEMTYTEVYENLELYNKIYYGGAAGTEPAVENYRAPWNGVFADALGTERLRINVPRLAYATAPLNPTTNAEIARYQVTGTPEKPSNGPVMTATTTNDQASYAAA